MVLYKMYILDSVRSKKIYLLFYDNDFYFGEQRLR